MQRPRQTASRQRRRESICIFLLGSITQRAILLALNSSSFIILKWFSVSNAICIDNQIFRINKLREGPCSSPGPRIFIENNSENSFNNELLKRLRSSVHEACERLGLCRCIMDSQQDSIVPSVVGSRASSAPFFLPNSFEDGRRVFIGWLRPRLHKIKGDNLWLIKISYKIFNK